MLDRLEALAREAQKHGPRHEYTEATDPATVLKIVAAVKAAQAGLDALHDMKRWTAAHAMRLGSHAVVMESPRMKKAQAAEEALRLALAELER